MVQTTQQRTEISLTSEMSSNLEEIGRWIDYHAEGDVERPRESALVMFVNDFIDQHDDEFRDMGEGQFVFIGDEKKN